MGNIDLTNDILGNCIASRSEIIGNTFIVDTCAGSIGFTTIKKIDGKIKKISEEFKYKLNNFFNKSNRKDSLIKSICIHLDKEFIKHAREESIQLKIEYYKNFILKYFKCPEIKNVLVEISSYDWIITTKKISNQLKKYNGFESINDDKISLIKISGKIKNTFIFTSELICKDNILMGNSKNCNIIVKNNINMTSQSNIYEVSIDYLINLKDIRKLYLK